MLFVLIQDLIRERTFEREDIQKKTFTKWINKHLSSGGQQGQILRFRSQIIVSFLYFVKVSPPALGFILIIYDAALCVKIPISLTFLNEIFRIIGHG